MVSIDSLGVRLEEIYTIFEGTSEIQRLVISRAISGMRIRLRSGRSETDLRYFWVEAAVRLPRGIESAFRPAAVGSRQSQPATRFGAHDHLEAGGGTEVFHQRVDSALRGSHRPAQRPGDALVGQS